jgi:hypothetical protein
MNTFPNLRFQGRARACARIYCMGQAIPIMPKFGQHPPFFSKMRTFFKNRPRWCGFYCNSAPYQRGRFLSCIVKKKDFFPLGFSVRSVGAGKLFVLDFPIHHGYIQAPYKTGDFQMPITLLKI